MGYQNEGVKFRPTIGNIIGATAQYFHVAANLILSDSRQRRYARPRQIAMYLSRKMVGASFPAIARQMNRKDHTTVMHAVSSIGALIETNETIRTAIDGIAYLALRRAARSTENPLAVPDQKLGDGDDPALEHEGVQLRETGD